ncbi:MAG: CvpA family protein, partial [Litoreibacter sp.]|nr:CvpA family protein [Litoreibacter sp.]
ADAAIAMVDDSRTARVVGEMSEPIDGLIPNDAPSWIVGTYNDLTAHCAAEGGTLTPTTPTTDG